MGGARGKPSHPHSCLNFGANWKVVRKGRANGVRDIGRLLVRVKKCVIMFINVYFFIAVMCY